MAKPERKCFSKVWRRGGSLFLAIALLLLIQSCSVNQRYNAAMRTYNIGEYSKSIEAYRKAFRETKDRNRRATIQFKIAEAYYAIGQYRSAENYYRSSLNRNMGGAVTYLHYADVLKANGNYKDAITQYEIYLDSVPGDKRALNGIASCRVATEWSKHPSRYKVENLKGINSRWGDFAATYVGVVENEIIFTSARDGATGKKKSPITGEYYTDIFKATYNLQKAKWDKPKKLDELMAINTLEDDGVTSLDARGTTMYFTRCRYDKMQEMSAEIYMATQVAGVWGNVERLEISNDSIMMAHPSISTDGKTLYFVSDRVGGLGGKDIWKVSQEGGKWGNPENMGAEVNTTGDEMFPFIRENGELYFASNAHPGIGGFDIFKATKNETGQWMVENMMAPVNSPGDDFAISFYPGEEKGLFTSNREGSSKDDIYTFMLPPKVYEMEGDIFDKESGARINGASVRLIGSDGTMLRLAAENGKFRFNLKPEVEYVVAAYKKGYLNAKATASTLGLEDGKSYQFRLDLTPVDMPVNVDNIYYEFGKWDLLANSMAALDSLAGLLKENPTIVIELMAHTDCRGNDADNSALSQKRAQSVVDYLIAKGIQPARLVAKGYGETAPKTVTKQLAKEYAFLKAGQELTCNFIESMRDESQREICHQINRRTEFKVITSDYKEKFEQ